MKADARPPNVVIAAPDLPWTPEDPVGHHRLATLWGDFNRGQAGVLLKLPGGFKSSVHAHTADYRAIVISGTWVHVVPESGEGEGIKLTLGSYWTQPRDQMHEDECVSPEGSVFFRFSEGKFQTYTPENTIPK